MSILLRGVLFFFLALSIHAVVWRLRLVKNKHITVLLGIFLAVFIAVVFVFKAAPGYEHLRFFLLYFSLASAYIVSYPAIQADSPSLVIVSKIAKASPEGLEKGKLYSIINDDNLVIPRIKDLADSGMVRANGSRYKLTFKGNLFVSVFIFYRKLLNLPKGG
jgi:predicted transcriptional regulator